MMLQDVQAAKPNIAIPLKKIGIRGVTYPFSFHNKNLIGNFDLSVSVRSDEKGAHMSRFVELLHYNHNNSKLDCSLNLLPQLHNQLLEKLETNYGTFGFTTTYYREKVSPVSLSNSLMHYDCSIEIFGDLHTKKIKLSISIPVTTLCPCSKIISKYGAHNQRSIITINIELTNQLFNLDDFIQLVEIQGSCELYGVLKRSDEKFVTEKAYDNPKFVEDLLRDLIVVLRQNDNFLINSIDCENIESIHHHSAYGTFYSADIITN